MFPPSGGCSRKIGFVPLLAQSPSPLVETVVNSNTPARFHNTPPNPLIRREFASNSNISTLQTATPRGASENRPRHLHDSTTDKEV
jgi:hypothetical protein